MFEEYQEQIQNFIQSTGIKRPVSIMQPPSADLGDFCIIVNQYAGKQDPEALGKQWSVELKKLKGMKSVSIFKREAKKGKPMVFLNFSLSDKTKQDLREDHLSKGLVHIIGEKFSWLDDYKGKTLLVEHTSANPISPLHVGNLRNSVHGDTLARIHERGGYQTFKHFYVNDVGLQISFVVVGYELARNINIRPVEKVDLWFGKIYAMFNCFYHIQVIKENGRNMNLDLDESYELKDQDVDKITSMLNKNLDTIKHDLKPLEAIEKPSKEQKATIREKKREVAKLAEEINDVQKYQATFFDLKQRFGEFFEKMYEEVSKIDLKEKQTNYLKKYEANSDKYVTELFREVVFWVLEGFKWTLARYNIAFDQFDLESDLTWSGFPEEIIEKLATSEFAKKTDGQGIRFTYPKEAINKFCKVTGIPKKSLPIKGIVPELQLRRSNGVALYAAKDIAYSIRKFEMRKPDLIYNVIGVEQTLPQFQLLVPLVELGHNEYAAGLKHYPYEMVDLRGRTMSGRLALYVTADDFYDETIIRARMAKRASDVKRGLNPPTNPDEWKKEQEILNAVALASTRYPLVDRDPKRRIVLDLDEELDFRRNPGPFVEYAHARTNGVLKKVEEKLNLELSTEVDYSLITDDLIVTIVDHILELEEIIRKSIKETDPSQIAIWLQQLAQHFMKFYETFPVLNENNIELTKARQLIVAAIKKGLATGLEILGIPAANEI